MDYKGWVLSIYDKYKSISNDNKDIKDKRSMDEIFRMMWRKENRLLLISFGISIIAFIIIGVLSAFKLIDNDGRYYYIPFGIMLLSFLPEWYKYEPNLDFYKKEIDILKDVLKENDLYEKEIIQELYNSTRGIFFNIKTVVIYIVGIVVSSGIFTKVSSIDSDTLKNILIMAMAILMIVAPLLYLIWIIMFSIPNSRLERSKKFHMMLKILIASDKELMGATKKSNFLINKYKELIK